MRVDTGIEGEDSFWVVLHNRKGRAIIGRDGGEFSIELYSPLSPEIGALKNRQLSRNEVLRMRFRKELNDAGVLKSQDVLEDKLWGFLEKEFESTAFDTLVAAVRSWKNFPLIISPTTRKPLDPQPAEPECTKESVQQFLLDNPEMQSQLRAAFNNEKNYLTEREQNSSAPSSNTQETSAPSTSKKEIQASPPVST